MARYRPINHVHLDSRRHAKVWKLAARLARLRDHSIADTMLDVLAEELPGRIERLSAPKVARITCSG